MILLFVAHFVVHFGGRMHLTQALEMIGAKGQSLRVSLYTKGESEANTKGKTKHSFTTRHRVATDVLRYLGTDLVQLPYDVDEHVRPSVFADDFDGTNVFAGGNEHFRSCFWLVDVRCPFRLEMVEMTK